SRRRHTRFSRDWSSDVCSSDLAVGSGVLAGGSMRAVLEAAGYTDVLAKSQGSANPHNVVKATFNALGLLREPVQVAKQRNVSLRSEERRVGKESETMWCKVLPI